MITRRGKGCSEFLKQPSYYSDLRGSSVCLLDKHLVVQDLSAYTHVAAFRTFMKTAREEGHEAPCVFAQVFDRVVQAPLSRLVRQWQSMYGAKALEQCREGRRAGCGFNLGTCRSVALRTIATKG